MTEQKTTTTIEVLAPARRCVVSGWQPSESLPCFGICGLLLVRRLLGDVPLEPHVK